VAARVHGSGRARLVRLMGVESGRSVPRAANLGRPDIEGIRADETMMRAVAVFVGREVRGAAPPSLPLRRPGSDRRRLPRHVVQWGDAVVTVR